METLRKFVSEESSCDVVSESVHSNAGDGKGKGKGKGKGRKVRGTGREGEGTEIFSFLSSLTLLTRCLPYY